MEYTVQRLAQLSGVSPRTLRYYDQIGLLKPARVSSNGYRIYGQTQVDLLQQILFYRALEVPLEEIQRLLSAPEFDRMQALEHHLRALTIRQRQTEALIATVNRTILSIKGEITMSNKEKFQGFKQELLDKNEAKYGKELRERYGEQTMAASNTKFSDMTEEQWQQGQALEAKISELLQAAVATNDPASPVAQELCDCHRQWLTLFWPAGLYNKGAHLCLAEGYLADERFRQHYEAIVPGGTQMLRDALSIYCAQ